MKAFCFKPVNVGVFQHYFVHQGIHDLVAFLMHSTRYPDKTTALIDFVEAAPEVPTQLSEWHYGNIEFLAVRTLVPDPIVTVHCAHCPCYLVKDSLAVPHHSQLIDYDGIWHNHPRI